MPACAACGAALPDGASFCPACGARVIEPPAGEERKLATVVFADLVGSTELAGSQDPERTRFLLDRFYDAMAAEIGEAGGTVEKFAGDAVMAAFGAPAALEDHAERALHAALAMRRRLEELFGERLALRIGINTGEVVAARPREGSSFVTGDPVNVAARLEQAAAPGEILAGERTVAAARGAFEFGERRIVEAKGKPEGVLCRPVVRALSLMRARGLGGSRAFVGRTDEIALLETTYERAAERSEPQLVTVVGEAGIGKTTLARELWQRLAGRSPEPLRRTGRCLPYGQGIAYWPLAEVLREQLGLLESDPPETALRGLAGREILGLTLGLDVAGDLHPLAARDRLHDAWVELVQELGAETPVVLLVEDLHWAEEALLDLLERLAADVHAAFVLLATARPELFDVRPGWGRHAPNAATISVEPLSSAEAERMLDELLASDLPASLRRAVVAGAEGNPFFVEELLATLIDRGVLERANGSWTVRELPEHFELPDSVHAVVAARIDLLAPAEKAALQAAAVIGRVFWARPLYELLEGVEPELRILEQREFVRRRAGSSMAGEQEYVIKHALTREVAYGSLPKARRARLHAAFARWLERAGGARDEQASLLAHHFAQAVRPEDVDLVWAGAEAELEPLRRKAVAWLGRAAELAAGRYEIGEALTLLDQALALEADDRTRIELLLRVSYVHALGYDSNGFRHALEEALALGPDRAVAAEIYARLAHYGRGRPYWWKQPPSPEVTERWLASALALAEPGTEARGEALLGRALGTPEIGAEAAAEVVAIAEALAIPRLRVHGYEAQALVASVAGRFEEACDWADRALAVAPALTDPDTRSHQYWHAGFVYLRGGRIGNVPHLAEEFDRAVRPLTPHHEVHAAALHALLQSTTGRWQALVELAARAESAAEANVEMPCQFNWRTLLVCALGHAHLGAEREARRLEERARAGAVVVGPPEREPALLRLAVLRGDLDEAERILELLPASGDPWGLDAAAARLDALAALGDRARVEAEAAPFLGGQSYTRPFALRALGVVRDDPNLLEQAAASFAAMGLEWQAAETRASLDQRGAASWRSRSTSSR